MSIFRYWIRFELKIFLKDLLFTGKCIWPPNSLRFRVSVFEKLWFPFQFALPKYFISVVVRTLNNAIFGIYRLKSGFVSNDLLANDNTNVKHENRQWVVVIIVVVVQSFRHRADEHFNHKFYYVLYSFIFFYFKYRFRHSPGFIRWF